jgi:hypothetical protein
MADPQYKQEFDEFVKKVKAMALSTDEATKKYESNTAAIKANREEIEKQQENIRIATENFEMMGDFIPSYKRTIEELRQRNQLLGSEKGQLNQVYKADLDFIRASQQKVDISNYLGILGKKEIDTEMGKAKVMNLGILASTKFGKQFEASREKIEFMNPVLKKMGFDFMKLGTSARFGTLAVVAIATAIGKEMWARVMEAREALTKFGGTTLSATMGLTNTTRLLSQWASVMTFWGIKAEQVNSMLGVLTKTYALQGEIGNKTGKAALDQMKSMGASLAAFMAFGKVSDMNQQQVEALASTMMLMHTQGKMLDNDFAVMKGQAQLAGVNVGDLADAMSKLAPSMMMSGKSTTSITRQLALYGQAITNSNDKLFDGVNKFAMAQKAMSGLADAASGMDISMLMAFGPAMGKLNGNLDDFMKTAVKADRMTTLTNYVKQVTANVPQQQKFTSALFALMNAGVRDINTAAAAAEAAVGGVDSQSAQMFKEQQAANAALADLARAAQANLPLFSRLAKATIQFMANLAPIADIMAAALEKISGVLSWGRGSTNTTSNPV